MTVFYKLFLDWVWVKLSDLVMLLIDKIKSAAAEKKINDVNNSQSDIVEGLRQEIITLTKAGKIVPKELEDKLRTESHRLITSDSGNK